MSNNVSSGGDLLPMFMPISFSGVYLCNGQIVGQPRKSECRQNARKMSKKCPKNAQKLSGGAENTIFGHFLDNFWLFGRCCSLVTLSNARPLQVYLVFEVFQERELKDMLAVSFLATRFAVI